MSQATLRDLCAEAINVDGTGDATFHGALRGHRTFAVAYAGALPLSGVRIKIEEANAQGYIVRWEDSECTVSESGFARDTCINSSNNGAFVEFGAGYKRAFVFIPVADVGGSGSITAADITDSSATGRAVLTGDVVAGRSALGISDTVDVKDIEGIEGTGYALLIAGSKAAARDILQLGSASLLDVATSGDATAGQVVKGSDSQLTNDRTASGLRTATTVVATSAATAPSAGQTLVATSSTAATWQTPASGGISIGDSVGGGTAKSIPFIDASGNLAQAGLTYDASAVTLYSPRMSSDQVFANYLAGLYVYADVYMFRTHPDTHIYSKVDGRITFGIALDQQNVSLELSALNKKSYTVGTVPLSRVVGDVFEVVDALAPVVFSPVVAGGSVTTDVRWDGTNLIVKG